VADAIGGRYVPESYRLIALQNDGMGFPGESASVE
jgi:hypothetical protein